MTKKRVPRAEVSERAPKGIGFTHVQVYINPEDNTYCHTIEGEPKDVVFVAARLVDHLAHGNVKVARDICLHIAASLQLTGQFMENPTVDADAQKILDALKKNKE